jgi:SAM-dependent methyltransferase
VIDADAVLAQAALYDTLLDVDERRRRGAFATPPELAAVLARRALPDAARVSTVLDPACGTGALLRAALDRLVALGLGPAEALTRLHGVDSDPVAVELCRAAVVASAFRLDPAIETGWARRLVERRIVTGDALLGPSARHPQTLMDDTAEGPDLVWHKAFPDVLDVAGARSEPVTGWRGGFGAVVANPPWERLKVFRREGNGAAMSTLRRQRADASRSLREAGRHPLTGAGEVNAYLPFVETCWRLLAPSGRAAVVVPAGIASDRSAAALMRALLDHGALEALHLLATDRPLFQGVSARVAAAVITVRHGTHGGMVGVAGAEPAEVAVGVNQADAPAPERIWRLTAELPRVVNPNTGTVPLCLSQRDATLLEAAHRRWPVLRRRPWPDRPDRPGQPDDVDEPRDADGAVGVGASGDDPWQVRLVTPLHMTRDAVHFRNAPGPGLLPLWEAKHAGLLDHRGGGRAQPRYWVPRELVAERFEALTRRGWLGAYRNVTTAESPRTLLPCALPVVGVGNSLPLIDSPRLPLLLAALASLPVDYLVRQKHAGANLNFFKLEQAAVPPPELYQQPAPWQPRVRLEHWVLARLAAALRWDDSLDPLATELATLGVHPRPPRTAISRPVALAELDAAHAVLLGWGRDDLQHVLATFGALRTRETREHGRFLTASRVLAAYDRLSISS